MESTPIDPSTTHKQLIKANSQSWLQTDYGMISAALDIEINSEISPLILFKIVKGRLEQMSREELKKIPNIIWEYIDALDVLNAGLKKLNPNAPRSGMENKSDWFTISFQAPDIFHAVPRGVSPSRFVESLKNKARFIKWRDMLGVNIQVDHDRVYFTHEWFNGLTTQFFKSVISSF